VSTQSSLADTRTALAAETAARISVEEELAVTQQTLQSTEAALTDTKAQLASTAEQLADTQTELAATQVSCQNTACMQPHTAIVVSACAQALAREQALLPQELVSICSAIEQFCMRMTADVH
jgi:septal ring factor EnvC (AmiA/AmiB activator)